MSTATYSAAHVATHTTTRTVSQSIQTHDIRSVFIVLWVHYYWAHFWGIVPGLSENTCFPKLLQHASQSMQMGVISSELRVLWTLYLSADFWGLVPGLCENHRVSEFADAVDADCVLRFESAKMHRFVDESDPRYAGCSDGIYWRGRAQCAKVCWSVLQCVAVCCSLFLCVAVGCSGLCCSVL